LGALHVQLAAEVSLPSVSHHDIATRCYTSRRQRYRQERLFQVQESSGSLTSQFRHERLVLRFSGKACRSAETKPS